ncbi:metal ABC transporter permease [Natronomonas sp. F2-12]|jgi:zinc transport system permease protein|uniref:Metal ABC transporter permease n=1 Tax=Natronomonas aquatica TaxID=2841590 RepID=A0A9R1D4S2_9EURY|nr:metal ABC transporter permease [Natronomonas aquatica]MCQ4332276.1 metal ABC transporter permease [Natronomonas aquatica]
MYQPIRSAGNASIALQSATSRLLDAVLDGLWGTALDALARVTGIEMLGSPFMQRAYLAAVCVAIVGPLVGVFLVHREMAMIGDTLAHSAFAGVAAGLFANSILAVSVPPIFTALVVAAVAALLVQTLVDYAGAYRDTSLAIVLTGSFAVGSVLITATDGGIAVGINAYLFGSLATVSRTNAGSLVATTAVVVVVVAAAYRPLVYVTFDEIGARAAGLDVARYNRLLAVLTAVVVVGAMQIMGVILVAAMLVIPVAASTSVTGFKRSVAAAVAVGQFATVAGVTVSYWYDVAAGGTIVLVAIASYLAVGARNRLRIRLNRGGTRTESDAETRAAVARDGGNGENG